MQSKNEGNRKEIPAEGFRRGTLVLGIGSYYTAKDEEGNRHILRCKKKFRRQGISPLTGDEVLFSPGTGEEHGWIEEILPRKTVCLRPPVANVTRLVIVLAPVPEADLLLADRLISRAVAQGMDVLIAVNKTDLDENLAPEMAEDLLAALRNTPGGEDAAVIGRVTNRYPGKVVLNTFLGGARILVKLTGAQLPRIC